MILLYLLFFQSSLSNIHTWIFLDNWWCIRKNNHRKQSMEYYYSERRSKWWVFHNPLTGCIHPTKKDPGSLNKNFIAVLDLLTLTGWSKGLCNCKVLLMLIFLLLHAQFEFLCIVVIRKIVSEKIWFGEYLRTSLIFPSSEGFVFSLEIFS